MHHENLIPDRETDTGIRFDDPEIGIVWPIDENEAIHSKRDMALMSFVEYTDKLKEVYLIKEGADYKDTGYCQ